MSDHQAKILPGLRALDLTDERGLLCGKVLGDLGVDVIKVERPGGDPARNIGPFYHDIPHPERSLFWFAFNTNKRGITLNIETQDGKLLFRRLARSADFVIESLPPGYLDKLGLGYPELAEINPKIIMTSITPFGQSGPYRDYKASDIVVMALGGYMYLCGDPDRPPVRFGCPQAYLHASMSAAVATLAAYNYREATGEGQHVDVSAQASTVGSTGDALHFWNERQLTVRRGGSLRLKVATGSQQRMVWPCQDGYVGFAVHGSRMAKNYTTPMVAWMESEGMAPDFLRKIDWEAFDINMVSREELDRIQEPIGRFLLSRTKAELSEEAVKRRIILYPVSSSKDLLEDRQLGARDFWEEVEHPELGAAITYPGPFTKASGTSCGIRRRPPLIGEHNLEILGDELGLSREELTTLKQVGAI